MRLVCSDVIDSCIDHQRDHADQHRRRATQQCSEEPTPRRVGHRKPQSLRANSAGTALYLSIASIALCMCVLHAFMSFLSIISSAILISFMAVVFASLSFMAWMSALIACMLVFLHSI